MEKVWIQFLVKKKLAGVTWQLPDRKVPAFIATWRFVCVTPIQELQLGGCVWFLSLSLLVSFLHTWLQTSQILNFACWSPGFTGSIISYCVSKLVFSFTSLALMYFLHVKGLGRILSGEDLQDQVSLGGDWCSQLL